MYIWLYIDETKLSQFHYNKKENELNALALVIVLYRSMVASLSYSQ